MPSLPGQICLSWMNRALDNLLHDDHPPGRLVVSATSCVMSG